ncbi:CoxG family protein [Xanthobacter sp. TB0136]|uniref:CoxG family protein n=1 Tax=Xanthobacter sp. TB0136 TaxID=3459177 RepID=UPI00403911C5
MELTGEYRIAAPRETVWAAILDPDMLRQCIPGCKELEKNEDNSFAAKVQLKIGPVSANFSGTVELLDMNAPESCRLTGQGNGGIAGFAKGEARVTLAEDNGETVLSYVADAQIGGKLAALGNRLLQSSARKLADQFFSALATRVGQPEEAVAEAAS